MCIVLENESPIIQEPSGTEMSFENYSPFLSLINVNNRLEGAEAVSEEESDETEEDIYWDDDWEDEEDSDLEEDMDWDDDGIEEEWDDNFVDEDEEDEE